MADVLATGLFAVAAVVLVTGGGRWTVGGLRVSIGTAWRPALAALAVLALRHVFERREPYPLRAWRAGANAARRLAALPGARWASLARALLEVVAVAWFLGGVASYYDRETGFTSLIGFGEEFAEQVLPAVRDVPHHVQPGAGYDGQFYAQLAADPMLRAPELGQALDTARYRAQRILFSWTAWLIGLGRPAWILQAYALQNVLAWLLLAWILRRWFDPARPGLFVPWAACLFGSGMMLSVRWSLLDGPTALVIAIAIACIERRRRWLAGLLAGMAGLARETNLLAATLLVERPGRPLRRIVALGGPILLAALPCLAWSIYVGSVYPSRGWRDLSLNFGLPFVAYVEAWRLAATRLISAGGESFARFSLAVLIGLTVQAVYLLRRREWNDPWWRVGIAYAALIPLLGTAVWNDDPPAAVRVLLPMTVAFNVLVARSRLFWPLVVLGNLGVWHGIQTMGLPWISRYL